MAYEDKDEILINDAPRTDFAEVQSLAGCLLLDATAGFDFTDYKDSLREEGVLERRVDYVLNGDRVDEALSRYIGVTLDEYGLQVVMLPFSEADTVTIPAKNGEADIEIVQAGEAGSLVCVDFFSQPFEPAGVRLEGFESVASPDDIAELISTAKHPELEELKTDALTVKYAGITLAVIRGSAEARETAKREFLIRKTAQLMNKIAENEDKHGSREELEEQMAGLRADIAENEWKIAHPVRGVFKEFLQKLFPRRSRSTPASRK